MSDVRFTSTVTYLVISDDESYKGREESFLAELKIRAIARWIEVK